MEIGEGFVIWRLYRFLLRSTDPPSLPPDSRSVNLVIVNGSGIITASWPWLNFTWSAVIN